MTNRECPLCDWATRAAAPGTAIAQHVLDRHCDFMRKNDIAHCPCGFRGIRKEMIDHLRAAGDLLLHFTKSVMNGCEIHPGNVNGKLELYEPYESWWRSRHRKHQRYLKKLQLPVTHVPKAQWSMNPEKDGVTIIDESGATYDANAALRPISNLQRSGAVTTIYPRTI